VNEQGRAQPGWYPDPSGPPGQQRWWDGTRWTEHLQPAQGAAPPGPAPGAPGAAPPRSGSSNTLVVVLIVLGVLAVLGIGGCVACAALVGEGAEDIGREFERELEREFNENAITQAEFDSVERGSRRETVQRRLGPPAETTEIAGETCLYYNRQGGELGDQFELCFAGGRLVSKSSD
jgi:hypothetical protein